MIRRPPRSTHCISSAASDVYKRQALVYVFTWLVKIQLPFAPNGGLIHLGNVPFFIACIFFSKRVGMLSGALGMGLFDLTSGWVAWSPMTVISALIMGYIMATLNTRDFRLSRYVLAAVLVTVVKVLTYYIGEAIMFKSLLVPVSYTHLRAHET